MSEQCPAPFLINGVFPNNKQGKRVLSRTSLGVRFTIQANRKSLLIISKLPLVYVNA